MVTKSKSPKPGKLTRKLLRDIKQRQLDACQSAVDALNLAAVGHLPESEAQRVLAEAISILEETNRAVKSALAAGCAP